MKTLTRTLRLAPIAALCAAALPALATNGYFPHGYGMKAQGMGGTSIALAQDSMGGATNPAAMVWAGSRMDLGVNWFTRHVIYRGVRLGGRRSWKGYAAVPNVTLEDVDRWTR